MNNIDNNAYFTIGEFVKLCNTTRATLYHYERLGLLSPIVNQQNGYRFYALNEYYTFMYIAHLIRMGFSLREVETIIADKRLKTYLETIEISNQRLEEQQELLRLRNERTQRGYRALSLAIGHPMNSPQITYREKEHFLRMPFNGKVDGKSCILCQAALRQYADNHNIEIQGHYMGFCSEDLSGQNSPSLRYVLTKLYEGSDCEYSYSRPSGMYLSMYCQGPFVDSGKDIYAVMEAYMQEHRFTPKSALFVEDFVGPFLSADSTEYISEMSVLVE